MSRTDRVVFAGAGLAGVVVAYVMAVTIIGALISNPLPPWYALVYLGVAVGLFVALGTLSLRAVLDALRCRW